MRKIMATVTCLLAASGCALINSDDPPEPQPIAQQTCYADFLDDNIDTTSAQVAQRTGRLAYQIAPGWTESERRIIQQAVRAAERVSGVEFGHTDALSAEATIMFEPVAQIDEYRAISDADGDIRFQVTPLDHESAEPPRINIGTVKHEIGHSLGLSHPGDDESGTRPDDWNMGLVILDREGWLPKGGGADGLNQWSDGGVVRPDGERQLRDGATIMADGRTHSRYRWMDVMALRKLYGGGPAVPGVRHFDGDGGTCAAPSRPASEAE